MVWHTGIASSIAKLFLMPNKPVTDGVVSGKALTQSVGNESVWLETESVPTLRKDDKHSDSF
jgi:hypothetical protein